MIRVRSVTKQLNHQSHSILVAPGTALALLVKCLQNLCAGEPDARKQVWNARLTSIIFPAQTLKFEHRCSNAEQVAF
jgi:hypothetical protein